MVTHISFPVQDPIGVRIQHFYTDLGGSVKFS